MPVNEIPFVYEDDQVVDYKQENVNHKFLERNLWFHTHNDEYGKALENTTISGVFRTDTLVIKEKDSILKTVKNWDSGWIQFDAEDFIHTGQPQGWSINYYYVDIEHNLGVLPTLSYLQFDTGNGIYNAWGNSNRVNQDFTSTNGGKIRVYKNTVRLHIGAYTDLARLAYRILLIK